LGGYIMPTPCPAQVIEKLHSQGLAQFPIVVHWAGGGRQVPLFGIQNSPGGQTFAQGAMGPEKDCETAKQVSA
jgi:hypothetical protein